MKFDQTVIVVYFRLEYVSCTILQTHVLELMKGIHSGGEKNLHSVADEEEGTELRFISCCTKMHISSFSGGSTTPRFDDREIANLLQQGFRMPKTQHMDLALVPLFPFLCSLKETLYASRCHDSAHYMCRSILATR